MYNIMCRQRKKENEFKLELLMLFTFRHLFGA